MVIDNLRAAVKKADWFDPELNPKVRSFAEHYGFVFLPTRPYMPRHKGKVENGVGYAQDNALKGRVFSSLEEQNSFLREWELTVADTRIHGTTRLQVGKHFADAERAHFCRCRSSRSRRFAKLAASCIVMATSRSSGPTTRCRRNTWRGKFGSAGTARMVRIFNERMQQIAVHARQEPGRFSTPPQYIAAEKITGVERGTAWLLGRVANRLGPQSTAWAQAMIEARGIEGVRVLQGLLSLAGRRRASAIEQACELALGYGAFYLRTIRALIKRQAPQQELLPLLTDHPMIRPMSEYGQFVHEAFQFRNTHE